MTSFPQYMQSSFCISLDLNLFDDPKHLSGTNIQNSGAKYFVTALYFS